MALLYAVATNANWNALSPAEQALYEEHYEDWALLGAAPEWSGTATVDRTVYQIGDITQSSQANISIDMDVYDCVFDGQKNNLYINYTDDLFFLNTNTIEIRNFKFKKLINGATEFKSVIRRINSSVAKHKYYNLDINQNNYDGTAFVFSVIDFDIDIYNINIINPKNNVSNIGQFFVNNVGANYQLLYVSNINIINSTRCFTLPNIFNSSEYNINNSYLDGSVLSYDPDLTDGGGNVTSDSSAPESANRNISISDAFIDTVRYLPKLALQVGVDPTILGHDRYLNNVIIPVGTNRIYSGANGPRDKKTSGSIRINKKLALTI